MVGAACAALFQPQMVGSTWLRRFELAAVVFHVNKAGVDLDRRSITWWTLVAGGAITSFLLAGCSKHETAVDAGIRTQTFHVGNGVEPQGLDPQTTTGASDWTVQRTIFEGLMNSDPVTGEPSPGVAMRWEKSSDLLRYTFYLRPEARWSNGKPVVANDFVRTAQRALSPALAAEVANDFFWLAGARAYYEGKERDFSHVGIRAVDALTLEYRLAEPLPFFLELLRYRMGTPLPIDVITEHGGAEKRGTPWTRPGRLVGNGAFTLKEWVQNKSIVVEKSPTYWDRDRVKLQRIVFYPVENAETEEMMFRAGQLHLTANVPPTKIETWRRDQPEALWLEPEQRVRFLVVNPKRPPLDDVRVRRALALAIDRAQIARVLGGGRAAARSLAPTSGADFVAQAQFQDDPATARTLLADAGYPGGKGVKKLEVLLPNRGNARLMVEMVQEMWRKNLGIEVVFNVQEWGVYIDSENNGQYDIAYDGWNMSHPYLFYDLNRSGSLLTRYLWSSAEYDGLLTEAARAPTPAAEAVVYARLEAVLAREMPLIPVHFETSTYLLHPSVRGWHPNPKTIHPVNHLWLEAPKKD